MAVTTTLSHSSREFSQQIDRITKSHSLRTSESLCRLLQYLAKQSLEHPDAPLKEYQIATDVYGRSAEFDPQSDSLVRVQAGRLRQKLAEYYTNEGALDPLVVKLPKGSYHLVFEPTATASRTAPSAPRPGTPAAGPDPAIPVFWRLAVYTLLGCLIVCLGIVVVLLSRRGTPEAPAASAYGAQASNGPLAQFWRPFTSASEQPWVIFSNAVFVGRPETGMRYYNAQEDAKSPVQDHYTGVGEVLAVHNLDDVFSILGHHIRVKRGSLFTLDDLTNANLIFVGSPSENLSLRDIPGTQEFVFQRVSSGPRTGDLAVVNKHPRAGEATSYLASRSGTPLTEDYAVVGLVPGVAAARVVMFLAGTTTFGTQGAVEFVSRPDSVAKLLAAMPSPTKEMRPFEALLHVKIARGVPVDSDLVALHLR
jgi:hypothetical protein